MATKYVAKFDSASQLAAFAPDVPGSAPVGVVAGTLYFYNGTSYVPVGSAAPVSLTAAVTLSPTTHAFRTLVANAAAGFAVTLPAATGSGNKYRIVIGTALATGDITVTAPSGSILKGTALIVNIGDSSAATVDAYPAGASDEVFTFDQSAGGGKVGDFIEIEDIASGVFKVFAVLTGQADPATPFSSAA